VNVERTIDDAAADAALNPTAQNPIANPPSSGPKLPTIDRGSIEPTTPSIPAERPSTTPIDIPVPTIRK